MRKRASGRAVRVTLGAIILQSAIFTGFFHSSSAFASGAGWEISMLVSGKKAVLSGTRQTSLGSPGSSAFENITAASTGASSRNSFGSGEGLYSAFFNQSNITKVAFVDGSSSSLDPSQHNNYLVYDLVESTDNEAIAAILKRLDIYQKNSAAFQNNDSVWGTNSVKNHTAGYSGTLVSSGGTGFKTNDDYVPDKFALMGINRDSDNDIQALAAYRGNLSVGNGKADAWRNQNPAQTFWSYWGDDFHSSSQSQRIGSRYQTSPGVATGASWSGNVYLLTYSLATDTTAPIYSSAAVSSDGTQVILTYDEVLSATTAATSAFTVTAGGVSKTISSVSISGSTVILNLSSAIRASQIVSFTYSDPSGSDDTNAVQDSAGNDAISLSSTSVTNNSTLSAAQAALSISSDISSKTYPYSQALTFTPSGGSGSGAITYAISAGGGATSCALSNSSSSSTLTATSSGTCLITATKAGDGTFLSATSSALTFTFNKANQANIIITSTSASFGSTLALTSTGGSTGGSYSYEVISGSCTIEGSTLTPTTAGSCVIRSSLAENTNYLSKQSENTTITISSTSVSATITLADGALTYRQAKAVSASASVAGKVTFKVNGKVIPGCKKKSVAASASVTCSYRPATRGYVVITATLDPTSTSYIGTTTTTSRYFVGNRTGKRAG